MRNPNDMNPILLDENFGYDDAIIESLMFTNFKGEIQDSGKAGDERIYKTLKWMEEEYGVEL